MHLDSDNEINELFYGNNDYSSSNFFPFEDGTCFCTILEEPFSFNNSHPENDFDDYFPNEKFEVKKETSKGNKSIKDIPPEFFNEKSINDIIEQFYIIEVKLNVLMDIY